MRIRLLFARYDDGESGTQLLHASDEYVEDSLGGVPDDYAKAMADAVADGASIREGFVYVADHVVETLFRLPVLPQERAALESAS